MHKQLLITLEFPPRRGGVGAYLESLCIWLDPSRTVVLADAARNSFLTDASYPFTLRRERLLYRYLWPRWLRALRAARALCAAEDIDQVIVSHLLPMGYVALLLGKPFTVICHGMDILSACARPHRRLLAGYILGRARAVIANSEYTKGLLVKLGVDPASVRVMRPCPEPADAPDAAAVAAYREQNGWTEKQIILSLGRLVERKGIDRALRALAPLAAARPQMRYVIAGSGPERPRLERMVHELGMEGVVHFMGDVSPEEKPLLYAAADIFLFPARRPRDYDVEGYGLVSLEAQAYGLPVIAGNTGGVPETTINGETGLLVDADRPETITSAVAALLDHPELRRRMGAAAKRHASACTWEREIESVADIMYTGRTSTSV